MVLGLTLCHKLQSQRDLNLKQKQRRLMPILFFPPRKRSMPTAGPQSPLNHAMLLRPRKRPTRVRNQVARPSICAEKCCSKGLFMNGKSPTRPLPPQSSPSPPHPTPPHPTHHTTSTLKWAASGLPKAVPMNHRDSPSWAAPREGGGGGKGDGTAGPQPDDLRGHGSEEAHS